MPDINCDRLAKSRNEIRRLAKPDRIYPELISSMLSIAIEYGHGSFLCLEGPRSMYFSSACRNVLLTYSEEALPRGPPW